jgi:hypothetical protein
MSTTDEIQPFWRIIVRYLLWAFLSSFLAGVLQMLTLFGVPIPSWVALVVFFAGIILALLAAAKSQYDKTVELAKRLRSKLSICSGVKWGGDRWRIKALNLSDATVRFGASLERILLPAGYQLDYQVPMRLQITGSPPPHRESDIPAKVGDNPGEAYVDVILVQMVLTSDHPGLVPSIEILSAEYPPAAIPIPTVRCEVVISVFPISPSGGGAARGKFYIIPQPDGMVFLSNAGVPVS